MTMIVSSANTAVSIVGLTVATLIPKLGFVAITTLVLNTISNIPKALAMTEKEKYQVCLSACRSQYKDGPDLIKCFQRCRQFYSA